MFTSRFKGNFASTDRVTSSDRDEVVIDDVCNIVFGGSSSNQNVLLCPSNYYLVLAEINAVSKVLNGV